jgi:hypothetical protein
MMNGRKQSDPAIVAVKSPNKDGLPSAEAMEPRAGAEENASRQSTHRTLCGKRVTHAPERVRQRAHLCVAVIIRGGSRMRESRTYGSMRGACSNARPYRDLHS